MHVWSVYRDNVLEMVSRVSHIWSECRGKHLVRVFRSCVQSSCDFVVKRLFKHAIFGCDIGKGMCVGGQGIILSSLLSCAMSLSTQAWNLNNIEVGNGAM